MRLGSAFRWLRGLMVLAALLGLSCATMQAALGGLREPTLTFKRVNLRDATLGGLTVELVYRLDNPNDVELSLATVDYALSVEGHVMLAGALPNGITIPASTGVELAFPATVRFEDLGQALEVF